MGAELPTRPVDIKRIGLDAVDEVTELFLGYLEFYKRPSGPEAARAFLMERLKRDESIILAARMEGEPALLGFAQVYRSFSSVSMAPVWILNDLFVSPHARRLGVGRALVRMVVDLARSAGAARVILSTDESNTSAQTLYESEGFTTGHPVRHYVRRTDG
ncbi:N-acetyltransferase [Micromonospora sp. MA102]|uniref:GNAT family N-acetyltransferase n=1 Tax=Micromonospora sp. MA102 TaxID=2952755 RepID=UPI0021C86126|nr:GNAT family N-acetyltransferase [Micromonospora sp. MA102]